MLAKHDVDIIVQEKTKDISIDSTMLAKHDVDTIIQEKDTSVKVSYIKDTLTDIDYIKFLTNNEKIDYLIGESYIKRMEVDIKKIFNF